MNQVEILSYQGQDNFVVKIATAKSEEIILAKVEQPASLQKGWESVKEAIRTSTIKDDAKTAVKGEEVIIPILDLSLWESFREAFVVASDRIRDARKVVQFRLDEKGAILYAGFIDQLDNGHVDEFKPGERTFIFDKPFMLILRESSDKHPYFMAWIGNSEVMVPHEK